MVFDVLIFRFKGVFVIIYVYFKQYQPFLPRRLFLGAGIFCGAVFFAARAFFAAQSFLPPQAFFAVQARGVAVRDFRFYGFRYGFGTAEKLPCGFGNFRYGYDPKFF